MGQVVSLTGGDIPGKDANGNSGLSVVTVNTTVTLPTAMMFQLMEELGNSALPVYAEQNLAVQINLPLPWGQFSISTTTQQICGFNSGSASGLMTGSATVRGQSVCAPTRAQLPQIPPWNSTCTYNSQTCGTSPPNVQRLANLKDGLLITIFVLCYFISFAVLCQCLCCLGHLHPSCREVNPVAGAPQEKHAPEHEVEEGRQHMEPVIVADSIRII